MKHFLKGVLFTTAFSLGLTVFASSSFATENKEESFYDSEIGSEITPLKETENGLVPMSQEEYENLTQSKQEKSNPLNFSTVEPQPSSGIVASRAYYEYYKFVHNRGTSTYHGSPRKVTATVDCNVSSCTIGKGVSTTVSASYTVSSSVQRKAIQVGASFNFVTSATDTNTYGFTISKGDRGYLGFKPKLKTAYGDLQRYSNWDGLLSTTRASGTSPVKLSNGEADGIYVFVHQ
ncbi:hypothetical protein FZC66_14140 [Priestia megaterium]|nr:hypothetical protein FZC66_14140 [Priestia megaterium]